MLFVEQFEGELHACLYKFLLFERAVGLEVEVVCAYAVSYFVVWFQFRCHQKVEIEAFDYYVLHDFEDAWNDEKGRFVY